jgi:hypothetical protein
MNILPLDVVNRIIIYVGELNHQVVMLLYNPKNNNERYKVNKSSNFLWKLRGLMVMKQLYPLTDVDPTEHQNRELYKYGKQYYEYLLKNKIAYHNKTTNH